MLRFVLLALCLAAPASAQTVRDCDTWQTSARNLPEPWSASSRTFANGAIRVALLDTVEPAAGAFYLMVLSPPYDELGGRICALVAEADGNIGFAGIAFDAMQAAYDPTTGLTLTTPVQRFNPDTGGFVNRRLDVTINQAAGAITARVR
jgi:hypothetical protein